MGRHASLTILPPCNEGMHTTLDGPFPHAPAAADECAAANLGGPAVSVLAPPTASGDYTWTASVPGAFYAFCQVGTHCSDVSQ